MVESGKLRKEKVKTKINQMERGGKGHKNIKARSRTMMVLKIYKNFEKNKKIKKNEKI